jgi:hypothetical protein
MGITDINARELAVGIASFAPPLRGRVSRRTGGTNSARYCYTVWLRHMLIADASGLSTSGGTVAELGPGDSLGVGLAALLSGMTAYYALDAVCYSNPQRNVAIFDDLVALFSQRAPIPGEDEFPRVRPRLGSYDFPSHILTDDHLAASLSPRRLDAIRRAIVAPMGPTTGADARHGVAEVGLAYIAPWTDPAVIDAGSVDMIVSQAVLEYPSDLSATYAAMDRWLRPGGFVSHSIDFSSHGLTARWSGHWACSDVYWALLVGRRPYILNRAPYSTHVETLRGYGYAIAHDIATTEVGGVNRARLTRRFAHLSDSDLSTRGAFIQAVKPG